MSKLPEARETLSIKEAASLLKVSTKTLRRWEDKRVLVPQRTSGGHRRYTIDQIKDFKETHKRASNKRREEKVKANFITPAVVASDMLRPQITTEKTDKIILPGSKTARQDTGSSSQAVFVEPVKPVKTHKPHYGYVASLMIILTIAAFSARTPLVSSLAEKGAVTLGLREDKKVATGLPQIQFPQGGEVLARSISLDEISLNVQVSSNFSGIATFAQDILANGGTITSESKEFDLLNENVTTLNLAGGASQINIGASGSTVLLNGNLAFEGEDINGIQTIFEITDPTAAQTITFPNATGEVSLLGQLIEGAEIAADTISEAQLNISNTPTDNLILSYDAASGGFKWVEDQDVDTNFWGRTDAITYLHTITDDVVIGSQTPVAKAKFSVDGDSDQIQLIVQAHSTQTADLFVLENSDGTDLLAVDSLGNLNLNGNFSTTGDITTDGNITAVGSLTLTGQIIAGTGAVTLTTSDGYIDADAIQLIGGSGTTISSTSGLQITSDRIGLLQGCADGELLKWNSFNSHWECANDTGAEYSIIRVESMETEIGTNVDTLDFREHFTLIPSPSNEINISIANDSLNFSELAANLTLDEATTITNPLTGNFMIDLTSTGDFVIADDGSPALTVTDTGKVLFGNIGIGDTAPGGLAGADIIGVDNTGLTGISGSTVQTALEELSHNISAATHDPVSLAGGYNYLTLNDQQITLGQIDLTADVSGVLPTTNGGTGLNTIGTGNQLLGVNAGGTALAYKNITDLISAGSGIGVSGTSTITVSNTGVLSLTGTANQINTTGSTGDIALSLPQNIHTGATPTFAGLTLSGLTDSPDNTVLVIDGSGNIHTDEIDSRVWGSSLVDGSGLANMVARWTDADTLGTGALFDNGTNVGIGTTNPSYKLDINPGISSALNLGTLNQNNQIGLNLTVAADTDGDSVYGIYKTIGTGSGPVNTNRYVYGEYNVFRNDASHDGGKPYFFGTYNDVNFSSSLTGGSSDIYGIYDNVKMDNAATDQNRRYYGHIVDINSYSHGGSYNDQVVGFYLEGNLELGGAPNSSIVGVENHIGNSNAVNDWTAGIWNDIYTGYDSTAQNIYGIKTELETHANDYAIGEYIRDNNGWSTGGTQYGVFIDLDDPQVTNYSIWVEPGSGISYFGSNVGIGTTDPGSYKLNVVGDMRTSGDLYIGSVGLGSTTPGGLAGADVIGVDNTGITGVTGTTVQVALEELSSDISGATHNPVTLAGSYDYLTLSNQQITLNQIDLTTDVSGVLPYGSGGTGLNSLGSGNQILGVNSGGTALEYKNISGLISAGTGIGVTGTSTITITNNGVTSLAGTTNQVNVSGSTGAITLSLPQNIHTGASPTFDGLALDNLATGAGNAVVTRNTSTNVLEVRDIDPAVWGTSLVTASGTPNFIPYFSGTDSLEDSSLYYTGGNLGIGTTSPSTKLHIASTTTQLRLAFDNDSFTDFIVGSDGAIVFAPNGTTALTLSDTQATFDVPAAFNATGDVAIAYNLNFTNATASNITSIAPLSITAGENFNSSDLKLKTYNAGDLVLDLGGGVTLAQAQNWDLADSTTALNIENGILNIDTNNGRVGIGTTAPGTKLDVVGDMRTSGDLYIGSVGLGSTAPSSGASLIGTYDEFTYSNSTNVQDVLDDLDSAISSLGGGTSGLWIAGTYGTFEEDAPVIVGADADFVYITEGAGDLRVSGEAEIMGGLFVGTTDYLQIEADGDLLFTDADGGASITGPAGGALAIISGLGQDLTFTADDDIIFKDGQLATGLNLTVGDTALNANLTQGIVDAINDLYDMGTSGGGSSIWSLASGVIYPTVDSNDLALGGSTSNSPFFFDKSSELLTLTNTTAGNSFVVNDEVSDTTPFVIDSNGNVGIGTTSPGYKLEVNSGTSDSVARFLSSDDLSQIILADDDTTAYLVAKDSRLSLGLNSGLSVNNLNVDISGNVGIGATSPTQKLHVAGAVRLGAAGGTYDVLNTTGTGIGNDASGNLYWGNDPLLTSGNIGSFGVSSVTNSDGTLTISPTTGDVVASLNLGNTNTWTGAQTFNDLTIADTDVALTGASTNFTSTGDFSVNTDDLFVKKSNGYVGIGTTAPSVALDVAGAGTFSGLLTGSLGATISGAETSINASSNFVTNINTGTSTGAVNIGNALAGALTLASDANSSFSVTTGDLTLQTITSGTLALNSAGAINLTSGSASSWDLPNSTVNALSFETNLLSLDTSNLRVGIGTTSPQTKLHVIGEIRAPEINKVVVVDGTTYPQTCAGINAAIDALGSSGGEIYLPEGTYTCNETITIDYNNTTIRGAGKSSVIAPDAWISWGTPGHIINLNGGSYLNLTNFAINGSNLDGGGQSLSLIYGSGVKYSTFTYLYLSYGDDDSISLRNTSSNNLIANNTILNSDDIGILLYSNSVNNRIVNNYVENSLGVGIKVENNSAYNTISNNTLKSNLYGVVTVTNGVTGDGYNTISNNTISITYSGYNALGISIIYSNNNIVTGNLITDNVVTYNHRGIQVSGDASNNILTHNHISGFSGTGFAIWVTESAVKNTIVANNHFYGNTTNINDSGTDTQITRPENGKLAIGNVTPSQFFDINNQFVVTNSGLVGIGTTIPEGKLDISGNLSLASWTTSGSAFQVDAATFTDTSGSGTIASRVANSLGIPTFASSNAVTLTDAANLYISGAATAGTNTTITNAWSLWVDAGNVRLDAGLNLPGLSGDTDDTVLILNSSNNVATREIDSRVWGSSLVDYTGTNTGYLPYFSDTDTLSASPIYTTGGNIGIGTTAPGAYKLNVVGDIRTSTDFFVGSIGLGSTTPGGLAGADVIGVDNTGITGVTGTTVQEALEELSSDISGATHNPVTLAGSYDYLTLSNQQITLNQIDLTTDVSGVLPYGSGGTGLNSLGSGNQILGVNSGGTALEYKNISGLISAGTGIGVTGTSTITITNNGVTSLAGTTNQVNVSGSTGAITLSLPQNIHTGASPTFAGLTLSGLTDSPDNTVLVIDGSGNIHTDEIDSRVWGSSLVDGSGLANMVARWTDADTLGTGALFDNGTNVGIGTTDPGSYKLNVVGDMRTSGDLYIGSVGLGSTTPGGLAGADVIGVDNTGITGVTGTTVQEALEELATDISGLDNYGAWILSDGTTQTNIGSGSTAAFTGGLGITATNTTGTVDFDFDSTELNDITWGDGSAATIAWNVNLSGTDVTVGFNDGMVGIGTTAPGAKLQVLGTTTQLRLAYDSDSYTNFTIGSDGSIVFAPNGTPALTLSDSLATFDLPTAFNAAGDVAVAYDIVFTNQTAGKIESLGPLTIEAGESYESNNLTLKTYNAGKLNVEATGGSLFTTAGTVATLNRTGSDGTIVSLEQDGVAEGSISVSGNTVSYNAFTGSHYAWTDEEIEKGRLVRMTGINRRFGGRPDAEIVYGITQTSFANDPAALGSYLSPLNPSEETTDVNPHLIMAVGNGELWVVDNGADLAPGDFLISSDTPGHAMHDTGKFPVSYVVARAAEAVDWDSVDTKIDGIKHTKISVLYDAYARNNEAAGTTGLASGDASLYFTMDEDTGESHLNIDKIRTTDLTVLGDTLLGDTTITGDLTVGGMMFDPMENSMDALGVLKIQPLALGNVEFMGGLVTIDTEGKVSAKEISAEKYSVAGASAGTSRVAAGATSVFVSTPMVTGDALVFVTPKSKTTKTLSVTEVIAGSGFRVEIPSSDTAELAFNWWIVEKK